MDKADNEQKQDVLLSALFEFRCSQDLDIESFLHKKSLDFLERRLCSVYLILNEELFLQGILKIEAYFTLSHKTLCVPENMSKTKIKNIGGFKTVESLHFVLIGQLGKYIFKTADGTDNRSEITIEKILDYAFEVIYASGNLIPCRCVLVECSDNEKVQQLYHNYGFKYFQFDGEHHQYYKILK